MVTVVLQAELFCLITRSSQMSYGRFNVSANYVFNDIHLFGSKASYPCVVNLIEQALLASVVVMKTFYMFSLLPCYFDQQKAF